MKMLQAQRPGWKKIQIWPNTMQSKFNKSAPSEVNYFQTLKIVCKVKIFHTTGKAWCPRVLKYVYFYSEYGFWDLGVPKLLT